MPSEMPEVIQVLLMTLVQGASGGEEQGVSTRLGRPHGCAIKLLTRQGGSAEPQDVADQQVAP